MGVTVKVAVAASVAVAAVGGTRVWLRSTTGVAVAASLTVVLTGGSVGVGVGPTTNTVCRASNRAPSVLNAVTRSVYVPGVSRSGIWAIAGIDCTALAALPMADVVALFFIGPLYITALGILVLGERPHRSTFIALFVGIVGVIVTLRPGSGLFEWASLLVDFAARSGQQDLDAFARKLYASAIANGLNRATGLAYGAVSRTGLPLDGVSRSWPQTEAVKAAIALDRTGGPDMKPEIEERVGRLFRWHIDPAPVGLWVDRIDERGRSRATEVPASIFYHLVCALTQYLDCTAGR